MGIGPTVFSNLLFRSRSNDCNILLLIMDAALMVKIP
jgi:hypothetical protein